MVIFARAHFELIRIKAAGCCKPRMLHVHKPIIFSGLSIHGSIRQYKTLPLLEPENEYI
jgi:hypothetical protein